MTSPVLVVGGGLAGCEAAWQLAAAGVPVRLVEMRPHVVTPAHRSGQLAELVCSNSLRSDALTNAVGLLKAEMTALGSLVMAAARAAALPAGGALAVDRTRFSGLITRVLEEDPLVSVERREIREIPDPPAILATGPLTSPLLHAALTASLGEAALSFFDAIAPVVAAESLDTERLFRASRYGKGGGEDYLNAPFTREEYRAFVAAVLAAEKAPVRDFEQGVCYFEGCLPIEVMAERGEDTLRFGPMKPVGLRDPRTGRTPYAVAQLRQDDLAAEHWNLVGFQTRMSHTAQQRVLRMIPGLEQARFVRLGMVHRNTFLCAPRHLDAWLRMYRHPGVRVAGQITGVEGYVESAATGLLAGLFTAADIKGADLPAIPPWSAHGGLIRHLTARDAGRFQPANISWGLMQEPPVPLPREKKARREAAAAAALDAVIHFRGSFPWAVREVPVFPGVQPSFPPGEAPATGAPAR